MRITAALVVLGNAAWVVAIGSPAVVHHGGRGECDGPWCSTRATMASMSSQSFSAFLQLPSNSGRH